MNDYPVGWRIAAEPAQDGDDWSVVFRMDDLAPDAAGPRIVVTAIAWSETEEIDVIDEDDEPEIGYSGVTTFIGYEVLGPDGKAMTSTLGEHIRFDPRRVRIPLPPIGTQRAYGEAFRKLSEFARTLRAAHDLGIDFVRDMIDLTASGLGETAERAEPPSSVRAE